MTMLVSGWVCTWSVRPWLGERRLYSDSNNSLNWWVPVPFIFFIEEGIIGLMIWKEVDHARPSICLCDMRSLTVKDNLFPGRSRRGRVKGGLLSKPEYSLCPVSVNPFHACSMLLDITGKGHCMTVCMNSAFLVHSYMEQSSQNAHISVWLDLAFRKTTHKEVVQSSTTFFYGKGLIADSFDR